MQEEKVSESAMFVTLTYDTLHVPITKNGFMSLNKVDLQKFFKRLRKLDGTRKIRYYAVGEYGGKTLRPHYHLILFNADSYNVQKAWSLDNKAIGSCHFGNVSGASIGYTLKYMMKPSKIPLHRNDDRIKEFALMSKGLGANYMTDSMVKWHKADLLNRMYCNIEDGKKISMPRYYKDKVYTEPERDRIAFFARQDAELLNAKREQELRQKFGDDFVRAKVEADKAAFRKMFKSAENGRDKI